VRLLTLCLMVVRKRRERFIRRRFECVFVILGCQVDFTGFLCRVDGGFFYWGVGVEVSGCGWRYGVGLGVCVF